MHLLEGFIALDTARGAQRWLDRADEIVRLFRTGFVDPQAGDLREYSDESLQRRHGVEGSYGSSKRWALNVRSEPSGAGTE